MKFSVGPVRQLIEGNPWGNRVFAANYRGDLPAGEKTRGRRKRRSANDSGLSFEKILDTKKLCCPQFLTRLEADEAPLEKYAQAAIELKIPLYLGIGAVRLDRNSISDLNAAKSELYESARQRAGLIMRVSGLLQDTG